MESKLSQKLKQAAQKMKQNQQQGQAGMATTQAFQQASAAQGIAPPAGGTGQSNIQEMLATQAQQKQGTQVARQIEQQAEQAKVQEAAEESEERQYQAATKAQKLETNKQFDDMLEKQLRNLEQFELDMDESEAEFAQQQLSFMLSMSDAKKQADADRRAKRADLLDRVKYKEEVYNMVSGEEMRLFQEDLARQKKRGYETLSHNEVMANLDIATAEALANATLQHEITTAAGEGWMQMGKAAASYFEADIEGKKLKESDNNRYFKRQQEELGGAQGPVLPDYFKE